MTSGSLSIHQWAEEAHPREKLARLGASALSNADLLAILTRGGIGGGDIKLIAALGLWLGGEALKLTALGGIIIGGLWALGAIAVKKKKRTDFIPYAPAFIIAAFALYILQASHG